MKMIEGFELSPQQKHLWKLQDSSQNFPYGARCAVKITGKVKPNILKTAIEQVISNYEILRTTFNSVPGMTLPLQVISPDCTFHFSEYNYTGIKSEAQLTKIEFLWNNDLSNNLLFNCALVTLSEEEFVLLLSLPALYVDHKGFDNLILNIGNSYRACSKGEQFFEQVLQYADISEWQNQLLQDEEQELILAKGYWRKQNITDCLSIKMPFERQLGRENEFEIRSFDFTISPNQVEQISELIQKENVSIDLFFLACWHILLWRITQQSEVFVGVGCEGRKYEELQDSIGLLAKYLPLKLTFKEGLLFKDVLTQIQLELNSIYTWQEQFTWDSIIDENKSYVDAAYIPFNFNFIKLNQHIADDICFSIVKHDICFDKFKVKLSLTQNPYDLTAQLYYDAKLFDEDYIQCLAEQFQRLLSNILNCPETVIDKIGILSDAEREKILFQFNDTSCDYPEDKCVHQLFEQQVEKTPDAVAVVFENQQLTYLQLNQKANQLAHYLQSKGVGSDVYSGICVDRSIEMVVGLLGILKAGGAYVPLDPNYPAQRLADILADASAPIIVTKASILGSLPQIQAQVVCLDSDKDAIARESLNNPTHTVNSSNLVYAIFTSGSTGKPKGAGVFHRGFTNLLWWYVSEFNLAELERVLLITSLSFDLTQKNIYAPLITGGTLYILPSGVYDAQNIVQQVDEHKVGWVNCTPSIFSSMLNTLAKDSFSELSSLKYVFLGGEPIQISIFRDWLTACECNATIVNTYGPTECSDVCSYFRLEQPDNLLNRSVPIGKPISNTQLIVLDANHNLMPIGIVGELGIVGAGVGLGYINNQERTSKQFILNPFGEGYLYKTGDLGRYLPDGNIEFLGRIDHQVKIRGFRIEPGEIETVLNSYPYVQQTVVVATEDISKSKRLIAYVVTKDESLTTSQLREFLKQKLPEYMVPSAFIILDTLPLTPNGKIDRKALPAADGEISREQEYVAPCTAIEKTLVEIWQELLLLGKVSINDNFFEIGGDSILSIQVVSRAKNSGIQITPQQIFQNQTIAKLARVANTKVSVSAQQGTVTGVAPLTPIQKWFWAQNRLEPHHYNQSVLLSIPQDIKPELLEKAIAKLLEHHDALRLRFISQASEHKQTNYDKDDTVIFSLVDLSSTPKREQPQVLEQIASQLQASLNLSSGPIMQVVKFNLGNECDARLLIVIHHLVVDGVSWRILLSDLETIYQQLIAQQPIQLSAKTTAFIDWAEKLNNYAQSEIIKQELNYWLNQPWSNITPLPLDYACTQPENTFGSAINYKVKLSVEETHALLSSVNEAYNTQINDILLSALVISLAEWTGNSIVAIDLEAHGREELFDSVDLSRTVGWLTSLFPVLLQLPTDYQVASVIKSIKEQLRTVPNRGIGYGILRYLCADTTVNQQLQIIPTPEISFNYLGQFDQIQSQTGWKFAPESSGAEHSPKQTRDHLLDINGLLVEGELQIIWTYSSNVHTHATVEKLAQSYIQTIKSIIEHCQNDDAFGYTPSDLPDIKLNQLELDNLLTYLEK